MASRRKVPPLACSLCSDLIQPKHLRLHKVSGWAKDRTQGGVNALRSKSLTGDVAHVECVDRIDKQTSMAEGLF